MKIYFKSLENADKQTVERISQNYPALSRSERSEIYRKIRARRSTASEFVGEEQVQGVERYRRPMWHAPLRITAAALALTLGLGGTVYAIHGFGRAVPPAASEPDPQSETIATEPSAEEITEPARRQLTQYDMSAQEGVYYKMLNCIDYYDRASGEFISSSNGTTNCSIVEFETDIVSSRSYSHYTQCYLYNPLDVIEGKQESVDLADDADNIQFCDGTDNYTYSRILKKITMTMGGVITRTDDFSVPDSERHVVSGGVDHWSYREQATNLPYARMCLEPWEMTFGFLTDFDTWKITGTEKYIDRECVSIEGTLSGAYGAKQNVTSFTFLVDKETGVLLRYIGRDGNGDLSQFLIVRDIAFDDNARKVRPVEFSDAEKTQIVEPSSYGYALNSNGQTYGNANAENVQDLPDLAAVVGDNGYRGYVYSRELLGDSPSSPSDAVERQEAKDNGTYVPKVLNVYEVDGITVIDTFTEQ